MTCTGVSYGFKWTAVAALLLLSVSAVMSSLTCVHESSGCSYNVSLREGCQLLENGAYEAAAGVTSDVYQILKSINDKLESKPRSVGWQAEDSEVAYESEEDFLKEIQYQDAAVFALLKNHLKTKSEQLATLHAENKNLQSNQQGVKEESLKRQEVIKQIYDDKQECLDLKQELQENLTNCEQDLLVYKHSLDKVGDQLSKEKAKTQLNRYQQLDSSKKLEAFGGFVDKVRSLVGLDVPARVDPRYDAAEDWSKALDALTQVLTERLSHHATNEELVLTLRDQNKALAQSLKQAESQLAASNSCQSDVAAMKSKSMEQRLEMEALRSELSEMKYFRAAKDASVKEDTAVSPQPCIQVTRNYCNLEALPDGGDMCWFQRIVTPDYNWKVKASFELDKTRFKALKDHTCNNRHGKFIFLDLAHLVIGQEAKLTSTELSSTTAQCFSFWYRIHFTFNHGKFYARVLILDSEGKQPSDILIVWSHNSQAEDWTLTRFTIPAHVAKEGYQLQLVAEGNGPGFVAVDDMTLTETSCY